MTKKKREKRDFRRILQGLSPKTNPTPTADLSDIDDPSFSPRYTTGFKLVITETMALLRRPLAFIKFGLFFYFFYFVSMMFIAYMLNGLVSFQNLKLSPEEQVLLSVTFLEIGKLFITPAFLLPWFAATWIFRRGGQVEIKWISEILQYRTLDLISLGIFSVLIVGGVGYLIKDFFQIQPPLASWALMASFYFIFQYYIHQLMVVVWDSDSRPWHHWRAPFLLLFRSWRMALGMITGLICLLLFILLLATTLIGIPIVALNIPIQHLQWLGFIILPILAWLILQWQALKSRLLYLLYLSQVESNTVRDSSP